MITIDCHTHLMQGEARRLLARSQQSGVERFSVLAVPSLCGARNNIDCLALKRLAPGSVYAFGGLVWQAGHCPRPEEQLRLMMRAGFDGLKLLESKPTTQKALGFHPQDAQFAGLFAYAQAENIPILWHVGDPAPFWHLDQAPAFAVAEGWTYDKGGFAPLQQLYEDVETVLERYPRLKVILAHFYFCSDDAPRLERLLARYPELKVDITPGIEMYHAFLKVRDFWQAFFERHHARILMGSDMTDEDESSYMGNWQPMARVIRGTLRPEPFAEGDLAGRGFELSDQALSAIWGGNFLALCDEPKAPGSQGLADLLAFYRQHLDADSLAACEQAMAQFA